jgi:hypothetical protein
MGQMLSAQKFSWKLVGKNHCTTYVDVELQIVCKGVNWFHLGQDRNQWQFIVNTVINFRIPEKVVNFFIM